MKRLILIYGISLLFVGCKGLEDNAQTSSDSVTELETELSKVMADEEVDVDGCELEPFNDHNAPPRPGPVRRLGRRHNQIVLSRLTDLFEDGEHDARELTKLALETCRNEFELNFDQDNDGSISCEERTALRERFQEKRDSIKDLYDADGNGFLSFLERLEMDTDIAASIAQSLINRFDSNADGIISYDEIIASSEIVCEKPALLDDQSAENEDSEVED